MASNSSRTSTEYPPEVSAADRGRGWPYRLFVIVSLSMAMAFSLIDRFALSLLFEPIRADLGLSDTQLGLLHGVAFGVFYATMGIPIAWLIDRWSRKWVIFWGIAGWSLMTALCGLARNFWQLLGARVGVGVGEAALAPAGYSLIADIIPGRHLATAISTFQMGALLGGGLAFLVGGELLRIAEAVDLDGVPLLAGLAPWQLTFMGVALPGLLFLALMLLIREPARQQPQCEATVAETGLGPELRRQWQVYSSLFVGNACLIAVNYGNMTWLPSVLVRQFGWELPDIGFRVGLLMLTVSPAGVLLGGLLADQWRERGIRAPYPRVLVTAAVFAFALVITSCFASNAWPLFAAIGAVQFATSLVIGAGPATVVALAPTAVRARVSAVYVFMINFVGLGIGPTLVGLLSDYLFGGDNGVLVSLHTFSIVMCGLAALFLGLLFRMTSIDAGPLVTRALR